MYDALLEALKCGDTSIPCVDFRKRYLELCTVENDTDKSRIEEEFEVNIQLIWHSYCKLYRKMSLKRIFLEFDFCLAFSLPISFKVTSQALGQSHFLPRANEAILKDMGEICSMA